MLSFFSFALTAINVKTIKTPAFLDNAHLHICLICIRLDVSSLTEIQYLLIEPNEKRTHSNERMILNMFFL